MSILLRLSCVTLALAWLAAFSSAGDVRIADRPLAGPFSTIQAGIDAALEGETLLVTPGNYAAFTIDGKSVHVLGTQAGSNAIITGPVVVKNLGILQSVVLGGLKVSLTYSNQSFPPPALQITNVTGHLRVHESIFEGAPANIDVSYFTGAGARIVDSRNVVFSNCKIEAGYSSYYFAGYAPCDGGMGVESVNSSVALYDCIVEGGNGSGESEPRGGKGGAAYSCTGYGLFASGCTFKGGNGGYAEWTGCAAGVGGDALRVDAAQAHLLANGYTAGQSGIPLCGIPPTGQTIAALNGAIIDQLSGTPRRLSAARFTSDGPNLASITISGQPGELVYLMIARRPSFVFKQLLKGVWMLPTPFFSNALPAGTIGSSGNLLVNRSFAIPDGSTGARMFWLQAMCVDPSGQAQLTGPAVPLSFDAASQPDCNGNGRQDALDVVVYGVADCNRNLTPDSCDVDCNGNGAPDSCDIASGLVTDCNGNGVPDLCDIASGMPDCNGNGKPDSCDIASHLSIDINANGIPDECESQFLTWYVDASAAPGGNGSPAAPFDSLLAGVNASIQGDTIELADGVYQGPSNRNLDLHGRDLTIRSANGPANCSIDCQSAGFALKLADHEQATIEGIHFLAAAWTPGAVQCDTAQVVVRNCIFDHNTLGGAIRSANGTLRLEGCQFLANSTANAYAGGALSIDRSAVSARDCLFAHNIAPKGGAVNISVQTYQVAHTIVFTHCSFLANQADYGGALYDLPYIPYPHRFDDCLFAGNSATLEGGALHSIARLELTNSTFVSNTAGNRGGSLSLPEVTVTKLRNTICRGSSAALGNEIYLGSSYGNSNLTITYCDIQGGQAGVVVQNSTLIWGAGNVDLDAQFVDADGPDNNAATFDDNDYSLSVTSPCIDAADNAAMALDSLDVDGDGNTTEPVPLDLRHQTRRVDVLSVPDTGAGTAPIVDMGAFERP